MKYKVKILRMLTQVMALWGMLAMCLLHSLQVCAVSANTVGDSGTPADQDGITGIFDENTINQTTLFDHLDIRIDNLPDISIDNPDGYSYNLYDTTRGDYVYRVINFPDLPDGQWADMKIPAGYRRPVYQIIPYSAGKSDSLWRWAAEVFVVWRRPLC